METKQRRKVVVSLVVLVGLVALSLVAIAGDLEPDTSPAPTMKTLDEVEPRIPIPGSSTPEGTFDIDTAGSYYLTGDRICSENGIAVNVDNVTIDLRGYSLIGPGSGTNYGVYMFARSNVEVLNGTVRNFGASGVSEADWYDKRGKDHRIINIRAISNGTHGIELNGNGHLVKDCTVEGNGNSGIAAAGNGCTVIGNTAYNNQGNGISAAGGCTLIGNTAYRNQVHGIVVVGGCAVSENSVFGNQDSGIQVTNGCTINGNSVLKNQKNGIDVDSGCMVISNIVTENNQSNTAGKAGILAYRDSMIRGNTAWWNKQNNVYIYGNDNTVEENLVTDSTNGIYFGVGGNCYANNRASGNTTNYANTAGNTDGGGNVSF